MDLTADSCGGAEIFLRSRAVIEDILQFSRGLFDNRVWLGELLLEAKETIVVMGRYHLRPASASLRPTQHRQAATQPPSNKCFLTALSKFAP